MRWQPAMRTLPPYHDDPAYIGALKASVEAALAALDFAPEALLASFHGMPERTLASAIPIIATARRPRGCSPRRSGRELIGRLPVALRPRQMARARDRRGAGRAAGEGRDEGRDRRPGLRRRLPRNARGAGDPRPRDLPRRGRHATSPICPASTTARRAWRCCARLIGRELEGWRARAIRPHRTTT